MTALDLFYKSTKLLDRKARIRLRDRVEYYWRRFNHKPSLRKLGAPDQKLIDQLNAQGVAVTTLDALQIPATDAFLEACSNLLPRLKVGLPVSSKLLDAAEHLKREAAAMEGASLSGQMDIYTVRVAPRTIVEQAPEFYLYGLNEHFLRLAEHYIGIPPAYVAAGICRDIIGGTDAANRTWHTDTEESRFKRQLKICVYLSDVSENSVCFEYIPRRYVGNVPHGRFTEQEMTAFVPSQHWTTCYGKRGTVILAATNEIYHRCHVPQEGGEERVSAWFTYTSRQPSDMQLCQSLFSREAIQSIENRLAPFQRECAFWY